METSNLPMTPAQALATLADFDGNGWLIPVVLKINPLRADDANENRNIATDRALQALGALGIEARKCYREDGFQ